MMNILLKLLRREVSILKNYKYILEGLDCANCAKKIEDAIAKKDGYQDVNVNFSTLKLTFKTDKQNPKKEKDDGFDR